MLKPHQENYKKHPQDQLEHISKSIQENGIYRNIVISNDNVILAGHGVFEACKRLGFVKVPTLKINISSSDPRAIKLLISDNEISHLAEIDQIKLSDHPYKILWAHHAYDQHVFLDFDHNIVNHIVSPSEWNRQMFIRYHKDPENKITVIPNGVADMFS